MPNINNNGETGISRSLQTLAECRQPNPSMEYFCPISRYCEWTSHTRNTRFWLTNNLGYIARSWNYNALVNGIETTSYSDLNERTRTSLQSLGFDEDKHDCCHVHYNDYDWTDFDDEGKAALEVFGYDQNKWDNEIATEYDELEWMFLPKRVQEVAIEYFCYTAELWDGVPISNWQTNTYIPGSYEKIYAVTPEPTSSNTASPTESPKILATDNPSPNPTKQQKLSSSPTHGQSPNPTKQPSLSPTFKPSNKPTIRPTLKPTMVSSSSPSTTSKPTTFTPKPTISSKPSSRPTISTQPSNLPTTSPTQSPTNEPSPASSSFPSIFSSKSPSSNPSMQPSSYPSIYPSTLGTKQPSTQPSTEPSTQRPTYHPTNTHRPTSIEFAGKTYSPTTRPSLNPLSLCRQTHPMVEYWCPIKRYCEWDFYDMTTRFMLSLDLDYEEKSWNYEVPAESENIAFSELKSTSQDTLKTLGFDEDKHDCCNGHYLSYFWNELHDEAREAWELLGYNEEMWDSGGFSKYDEYDWDDLPRDIQLSASAHLCYSRELWDQEPLPLWPQNAILPGAFIGGEPVTGSQSGVFQSQTSGGNMLRACSNLGMSVITGMLLMFNLVF